MEVPIYEDLQAYIRNSAVYGVGTMKTPLLISVGDQDGTVFWHQGLELYNIARRAGKNVVLVAYAARTMVCARNRTRSTTTTASRSGSITT
jgi:dipeptidyl aminopeptidase/acylaminoacyl peptidase